VADALRLAGHHVQGVSSAVEALRLIGDESFDVIITDLQMPGMDGLEFIRELERRRYGAQVLMITAHATVASAVEAMKHGALDYLEKPFDSEQLENRVSRALGRGRMIDQERPLHQPATIPGTVAMIGESSAMRALRARIAQVAPTDETVLITGESGTGKELVARAVHAASRRASAPLVSLNCPVLSAHLMESELFGHEKGAFTGADAARNGRFELADRGTILLDEISEIEPILQAKLLRVLQERQFERVGSSRTISVDVRVLATSNRDLPGMVKDERFRGDLYYRLAVVPLEIPPLRARREDVPLLLDHFLKRAAARQQKAPCSLQPSALDLLVNHHWPGNVRELENVATRATVLNLGQPVTADELRPWLIDPDTACEAQPIEAAVPVGMSLEQMEQRLIEATLERFDGHRAKSAEALGIGLRTLSGKLRQYGYAPRAKARSA
jgi:DNA-binding NtrC family response regulator